ncbi:MAG: pyrroloquinoline quinone-dependent dehydrogenase [Phycisphaerae bacterium]|jgi:quinoprotein glucose dehydrogenase
MIALNDHGTPAARAFPLIVSCFPPFRRPGPRLRLLPLVLALFSPLHAADSVDWPNVGNDKGGCRYSTLDQINRGNVARLEVAWTWKTGDAGQGTTIECTPIVIDGVMYVTTVRTKIAALDAATGTPRWVFDPYAGPPRPWVRASGGVNRGVAYWSDGKPGGQRRILSGLSDGRLISLDANTGRLDPAFGREGVVDLREGLEWDTSKMSYGCTSAPAVFEDVVILGFSTDEGLPGAPGDVRAFDVRTGRQVWRFHTIPRPGEFAGDTWPPDGWKRRGGANAWSGFTLDVENGIVFCGTGSASADFYGADRPGDNLFANCTLALEARTGRRLWHFQSVRHDIWDHDLPCPPVVVTVQHDGKPVQAVAQLTKTGHCWLLERKTGRPLFGMIDVPAPPSEIPGEQAAASQPEPLKPAPFSRQIITEADLTDLSPEARREALERLRAIAHDRVNTPLTERGTLVVPGLHGGANWSGAAFDPTTGRLYFNSNNVPNILSLKKNDRGGYDFMGYGQFLDREGYPAIRPPWGNLNCLDLNTGEYDWQITLGEFPELTARGIPPTGTETFGGAIVTAGGLVFIGGTKDEKFRAFDKAAGELLWQFQLPAGGYATPCTYQVNGRQFVAIAAGGGGKLRTRSGDAYFAFALPK